MISTCAAIKAALRKFLLESLPFYPLCHVHAACLAQSQWDYDSFRAKFSACLAQFISHRGRLSVQDSNAIQEGEYIG